MSADPLIRLLDEASDRYSAGYYQGEHEPAFMELLAGIAREHIAAEIEDRAATDFGSEWRDGVESAARIARRKT